ncbi:MAG: site-specific integrase [Deltaproteobacteria bacterium]|nr:site-specific integrase [Deltaproteobacteria bacterium]
MSFEEFAKQFLEQHVRVHHKYSTLVSYESALSQHLVPFFKTAPITSITERDVAALQAHLLDGSRTAKTVRNVVAVLGAALRVADEWKLIDGLPTIRYPKAEVPTFRFLTLEQCRRLETGTTAYWLPMQILARKAGLRLGELCALEGEQFDLSNARVRIDRAVWRGRVGSPKYGKTRVVDLSPATVSMLRPLIGKGLVFPSTEGRMRLERKCDLGLRRCATRAGLEPFGWHVLRHTYASHLAMAGVPLPVVAELMGHGDIRVTMRYAHLSPTAKREAVVKLDAEEVGQS